MEPKVTEKGVIFSQQGLAYVVLQVYAGAGLATAARLKWDPTTYIAVRELFPAEYRVAAGVLVAGSAALLALAHLAAAPLCLSAPSSPLARLLYILVRYLTYLHLAAPSCSLRLAARCAALLTCR